MTMETEKPDAESEEQRQQRRLKATKRHADLVDEMERGLSIALQEYRILAEEVLAKHVIELEAAEQVYELELAKLRAENGRLREALGQSANAEGTLFQTVMFQQMEEPVKEQTNNRRVSTREKKKQVSGYTMNNQKGADDSEDKIVSSRKLGKNVQQAGAWQHFVAWVPNAAALLSPQPWKPLPPEAMVPSHVKGGGVEFPMLPGMVAEDEKHEPRKKARAQDCDSTDSDSNPDDREPYEVAEAWKATQRQLDRLRKNGNAAEFASRCSGSEYAESSRDDEEDYEVPHAQHWFIIHPNSKKRVMWDLGSLIMVIYDMVMIPMSAFTLPEHGFLDGMDWCTRLFWTFDIGWSVTTAVVLADGKINFRPKFIIKRYLKTWFGLDLLIVSSDWLEEIMSSTNVLGLGRLARAFRLARIVRLLRLVRMQEIMQAVTERIQSDKLAFILSSGKLLIFVVVNSHVLACIWWAVGNVGEGPDSWIQISGLAHQELGLQYLVSLHWALCQFTGGMDEIVAISTLERFYTVCSWVFAFMATAVICSILTSNLTHLHIIGGAQARQMATLRKYLKQNHISSNLALQVQRSAQHAVTGDLAAEDVQLLSVVAEPLRVEINFEIYSSLMRNHPFFSDYFHEDPQVMRRICHVGMSMRLLEKGDVVFSKGEVPREPKMYFVSKGLLEYYCRGETLTVGERQWMSEPALWTNWTHKGTFTAITESKMAILDVQSFKDIVHRFKGKNSFDPRLYANEFIEHLNNTARVDDLTFMS